MGLAAGLHAIFRPRPVPARTPAGDDNVARVPKVAPRGDAAHNDAPTPSAAKNALAAQPRPAGQAFAAQAAHRPSLILQPPQVAALWSDRSVCDGSAAPGAPAATDATPACAPQHNAITVDALTHYLSGVVHQHQWQEHFWPPQKLRRHCEQLVAREHLAVLEMHQECPVAPLALFAASLFHLVILGDDSGSMRGDCRTGRIDNNERWDELRCRMNLLTDVGSLFDPQGLDVYFLNEDVRHKSLRSDSRAHHDLNAWMRQHRCRRSTPIGPALETRVFPDIRASLRNGSLHKPVLVYILTDGEPDDRRAVSRTIARFSEELGRRGYPKNTVRYSLSQVGCDRVARAYLAKLDGDRRIGHLLDATSSFELEAEEWHRYGRALDEDRYLMKFLVGACDRNLDRLDERPRSRRRLHNLFCATPTVRKLWGGASRRRVS